MERNRQLSDLFEYKSCSFTTVNEKLKTKDNFEQHVAICNILDLLIDRMIQESNIDENNLLIRIGLDDGGGSLKVCLSVFDFGQTKKSRLGERFKDSGIKKVMIIGIVPEMQENYFNVKRLWLETGIEKISRPFTIATDLKLANILLGLMSHSSQHPCCWCDINKDHFRE